MKAKLYEVKKGIKKQLIIARSKNDAIESADIQSMGTTRAELIGSVKIAGSQIDGITDYVLLNDKFVPDFGRRATISNNVYDKFSER